MIDRISFVSFLLFFFSFIKHRLQFLFEIFSILRVYLDYRIVREYRAIACNYINNIYINNNALRKKKLWKCQQLREDRYTRWLVYSKKYRAASGRKKIRMYYFVKVLEQGKDPRADGRIKFLRRKCLNRTPVQSPRSIANSCAPWIENSDVLA